MGLGFAIPYQPFVSGYSVLGAMRRFGARRRVRRPRLPELLITCGRLPTPSPSGQEGVARAAGVSKEHDNTRTNRHLSSLVGVTFGVTEPHL